MPNFSERTYRLIWIAFMLTHGLQVLLYRVSCDWIMYPFWEWWHSNFYSADGIAAKVLQDKERGYPPAQPYGTGELGVRQYLGWRTDRLWFTESKVATA